MLPTKEKEEPEKISNEDIESEKEELKVIIPEEYKEESEHQRGNGSGDPQAAPQLFRAGCEMGTDGKEPCRSGNGSET